jgi:hypothetical protein
VVLPFVPVMPISDSEEPGSPANRDGKEALYDRGGRTGACSRRHIVVSI